MKLRNFPSWFGSAFLRSSQSWQSSGKKHIELESQNDLMNVCSRSGVRLIQLEQPGENLVRNSGTWTVSKQCWCVVGT